MSVTETVQFEFDRVESAIKTIRDAYRSNASEIKGKGATGSFHVARCWKCSGHSTTIGFDCAKKTIAIGIKGRDITPFNEGADIRLQYVEKSGNIDEGFQILSKQTPYFAHYVWKILYFIVEYWCDIVEDYPAARWYGKISPYPVDWHFYGGSGYKNPTDVSKLWKGVTITSLTQMDSNHLIYNFGKHSARIIGPYKDPKTTFEILAQQYIEKHGYRWRSKIDKFKEELKLFCEHKRRSSENYTEFARQVELFAN